MFVLNDSTGGNRSDSGSLVYSAAQGCFYGSRKTRNLFHGYAHKF